MRLHAARNGGVFDMAAMPTHRRQRRWFRHHNPLQAKRCGKLRLRGNDARPLLAGFLIRRQQQRCRHLSGQAARGDDAGRDRALHIHATQPMQHAIQDTRHPGRVCPAGFRHRIHMAGQRITAARAAMRDQGALGHPLRVRVVQAFDLEPR